MQSIVCMIHKDSYPYSRLEARRVERVDIVKAGDFITIDSETLFVTQVFNRYDVVKEKMVVTVLVRFTTEDEQALLHFTSGD